MNQAILDSLNSPRRREILRLVWREERTAGAIHRAMPDVTFGAVSLQLGVLVKAGLVDVRAQQRNRFYRARRHALEIRQCQGTVLADWIAVDASASARMTGTNVFALNSAGRIDSVTGFANPRAAS